MLAILNSLNAHDLPIFQPILMIHVSKFMVYGALSDKTYLSLGLLSPLNDVHVVKDVVNQYRTSKTSTVILASTKEIRMASKGLTYRFAVQ